MGEAIVAEGQEVEEGPALAVGAAHLPGAEVIPFRLVARPVAEGMGVLGWPDAVADAPGRQRRADPHARRPVHLPRRRPPDASSTRSRARRSWWAGSRRAAAARAITGFRRLRRPQRGGRRGGCSRGAASAPSSPRAACRSAPRWSSPRPRAPRCTSSPGMPALAKLEEVVAALEPVGAGARRRGRLLDRPRHRREHARLRPRRLPHPSIHGGDRDTGALVVGEHVRVGQTMRFHVRDADSADEDLRAALRDARAMGRRRPAAALVFSCNGRGTRMFPRPTTTPRPSRRSSTASRRGALLQRRDRPRRGQSFLTDSRPRWPSSPFRGALDDVPITWRLERQLRRCHMAL